MTFPIFGKVSVRGDDQVALYKFLTEDSGKDFKGEIHWAFTKFLIGKDGKVLCRFEPGIAPDDPQLILAVEQAIAGTLPKKETPETPPRDKSTAPTAQV